MSMTDREIVLDVRMMKHSGIGSYIRGILRGMCFLPDAVKFIFTGPLKFRSLVPERLCSLYFIRDESIYSLREQLFFPQEIRFKELYHSPHYNIPLRFRGKHVVTIHDLNHLLFPENLSTPFHRTYARYMYREAVTRASEIIAVSKKTKQDLVERYHIAPEKINVIYNAVREDLEPCKDEEKARKFRSEYGFPEQYLLCVGINKPHKNYSFLIRSLKLAGESENIDIPLVIAGLRPEDRNDIERTIHELQMEDRVIIFDQFDHETLPLLFSGALALVFPSLYEGFGLPPLEAMKLETPVAASSEPPIPEVAGDAAIYFDPRSEEEASEAVIRIVEDTDLRLSLIEKGRRNLQRFDWKKTAAETLKVYRRALERE